MLKPENKEKLAKILKYHVVAGNVHRSTLASGKVETISGDSITIESKDGTVKIDAATVTTANIIANNGIIHVIDKVLIREEDESVPATASPSTSPSASPSKASAASIYETASGIDTFSTLSKCVTSFNDALLIAENEH